MTKDVNGMKKKRGRPALGRTRKLTRGVTVKFSPVSYEALRFRAGKSGRSLAVYISTGGHRDGKAYTGGERTVAQPGGNG